MKFFARLFALSALALSFASIASHAEPVRVFAAASLKTALDQVSAAWTAKGKEAVLVYAGSPALAKQIADGAPADVFISADLAWMDDLQDKKLIKTETRFNLLGNTLVLISSADTDVQVDLTQSADLAAALKGGKLAVASVDSVPAGRYAKAALVSLKLWDNVQNSLAQTENVRAALALVATGEAPLGIVYGSDVKAEPKVRIAVTFPESSHPQIVYPVAITTTSINPDAAAFLVFLHGPEAKKIFEAQGFNVFD